MKFVKISIASVFGVLAVAAAADETITITLPASKELRESIASTNAAAGKLGSPAASSNANRSVPSTRSFASRGTAYKSKAKEKVVGRLGILDSDSAIYGSRAGRRQIARVHAGTYLALNTDNGDWYGVLMVDKSTGWIKKDSVRVLSYEVVAPQSSETINHANYPGTETALLGGGQKLVLDSAYTYMGVPYVWGGTKPSGLDCSGLVQRCFRTVGVELPRTAHEQIACGIPIPAEQLRPADRLYFAGKNGFVSHTGIYIGNGYFIHASSANRAVSISRLDEPMYTRMFVGARR